MNLTFLINKIIKSSPLIVWTLALLLVLLQGHLFLVGFRLSADDVMYHARFMDGTASMIDFIYSSAIFQGRVGNYLNSPLLLVGAYYADQAFFRLFYVALYFLNFLLFAKYIAALLNRSITLFLFIVMVVFNPLGYNLSPPNAYPLLLGIPFLMILCSRLALFQGQSNTASVSKLTRIVTSCIFGLSMLINEYAFIFGVMLLIAEFFASLTRAAPVLNLQSFIAQIYLQWRDWLVVLLVLIIYFAYRWIFPTQYNGNIPNGIASPWLLVQTIFAHIYFGLSIAPSTTLQGAPILLAPLKSIPLVQIIITLTVFLLTLVLVLHSSLLIKKIKRPITLFFLATALAIFACIPIALTEKYQSWLTYCKFLEGGPGCAYIDSRIAYFAVCVALFSIFWIMLPANNHSYLDRGRRVLIALLIGVVSAFTYLHNWRTSELMKNDVAVWKRAAQIACSPQFASASDEEIVAYIDPNQLTQLHPEFLKGSYWRNYLANQRQSNACDPKN
jgi:hypothetical protein